MNMVTESKRREKENKFSIFLYAHSIFFQVKQDEQRSLLYYGRYRRYVAFYLIEKKKSSRTERKKIYFNKILRSFSLPSSINFHERSQFSSFINMMMMMRSSGKATTLIGKRSKCCRSFTNKYKNPLTK